MPDKTESTTTELMRVPVPARLVTLRRLLAALGDDVHEETMVTHYNGSLIVREPNATLVDARIVDDDVHDETAPAKASV